MNNTKIKAVMDEVATEAAERDELIQCIAVALLAKKNLFIPVIRDRLNRIA